MQHLYFGGSTRRRARRKAALKRVAFFAWLLTFAATALGIAAPSPTIGMDFVTGILNDRSVKTASVGIETSETAASAMRFRSKMFEERPTPSPSPTVAETPATAPSTPAPATGGSVVDIIYAAAAEFGISGDWLLSIAECESGLDPSAYNAAGYHGLFQYDEQTWGAYGYGSIYDPVAQARTTAELLAAGQSSRWPNCA